MILSLIFACRNEKLEPDGDEPTIEDTWYEDEEDIDTSQEEEEDIDTSQDEEGDGDNPSEWRDEEAEAVERAELRWRERQQQRMAIARALRKRHRY